MSQQQGKFYHGTYGYPLRIKVNATLTDIELIRLELTRNNETVVKTLTTDNVTNATTGELRYMIEDGDLPVAGKYRIRLLIDKTGNRRLVTSGVMEVA